MTDNNKPEWFEIAEKDQPSVPRKASKTLPLAAVLAATLIIGVGAVVAQVQEKSPATALDTTSVQTTASSNTSSPTSVAQNSKSSPVVRIANPAKSSASTGTSGLQNPSIAKLPTKGGDDDDENEGRSRNGNHGDDDEDEGDDD
jgi:cytoskeletal protein RodZ